MSTYRVRVGGAKGQDVRVRVLDLNNNDTVVLNRLISKISDTDTYLLGDLVDGSYDLEVSIPARPDYPAVRVSFTMDDENLSAFFGGSVGHLVLLPFKEAVGNNAILPL